MLSEVQIRQITTYLKKKPILKAWVFGSYARGENQSSSDIDLLVRPDYSQRLGWAFLGIKSDLQELLDSKVDVVSEAFLKDFARPSVEKERKLIYERRP